MSENALGFHSLVIYFLFWQFGITILKNSLSERFQSRYAWGQSFSIPIPIKERCKFRFHPDPAPNLVPNLSWSWFYLTSIPALVLILSRFYRGSVPIPLLSHSAQKENLVSFQVRNCILTISR
jgi:hypothetical protein